MQLTLHNLKSRPKLKPKKRVGRGNASGKGTYSTRGIKGQRARSGGTKGLKKRSLRVQLIKKIPKLGGFKSLNEKAITLTLKKLETVFKEGEAINHKILIYKNLIPKYAKKIKIVASQSLGKKLIIEGIALSKNAADLVKKAGGEIRDKSHTFTRSIKPHVKN